MLHRAASNAYSWWWASHIRTKQSKWMEQNLQDTEEKVQYVLKLLEEEGDSFAKRAEMYYKRRPELISFVEETFKAYRSLAERYDHISKELQNANNTIASFCPDQVPLMEEDDDDYSPRPRRNAAAQALAEGHKPNIPKVPKVPLKDLKSVITVTTATKKFQSKKTTTPAAAPKAPKVPRSGLSRKEALQEIDKLQKQILSLQTVKEFVKSTYDNAIAKYWDTEEEIKQLQERVSVLQDELGEGVVIEDDEARRLMAEAALKSCQETLAQLEVKQERSNDETKIESKRIKEVKAKLSSLMDQFQYSQSNSKEPRAKRDVKKVEETKDVDEEVERLTQQKQELQLLQENIKEQFEAGSNSSLSVTEMAEKIDELVNKVISLETAVSSQTALVKRLRSETDELHSQVRSLEGDKESLMKDKIKLNDQLRQMEEKMNGVQDLNQIVEDQNSNLQTDFTEARCNLHHLSEKVENVRPVEEVEITDPSQKKRNSSREAEPQSELEGQVPLNQHDVLLNDVKSDKVLKVTGSVEDAVKSDKGLKVTGSVGDAVNSDKELKADVTSDNRLKVIGSPENGVHTDNEHKITGSLENEVKSKEAKVAGSLEEATPVENKSPMASKEKEKTVNPDHSAEKAAVALSTTTTGKQEVSHHPPSSKADDNYSEISGKQQENDSKQISSETNNALKADYKEQGTAQDEPDWRQLFMNGMQDREQVLLTEYTNTLRNYKDVKKKLGEIEKKYQDNHFESLQLKELKNANAMKDEEIRLLRQKLGLLQKSLEGNQGLSETNSEPSEEKQDFEDLLTIEEPESTSAIEEKFRMSIDEILEENLDFWLKFSTSFTEIQKFETTIRDLQAEVSKLEEKGKSSEGSTSAKYSLKSDARPIYKHLTEIQNELTVWMEKSALLKEELQRRFSSLCEIQEEISGALKASAEDDDFKFTSYQAAKFQGEVLNMKQENNKVADELQAGLDVVTSLQLDVEKALARLNEQFELSTSKRQQRSQMRNSENRAGTGGVPLRSFIFGVKPKKQKQSIFSCMTPGMNRKLRANRSPMASNPRNKNKQASPA